MCVCVCVTLHSVLSSLYSLSSVAPSSQFLIMTNMLNTAEDSSLRVCVCVCVCERAVSPPSCFICHHRTAWITALIETHRDETQHLQLKPEDKTRHNQSDSHTHTNGHAHTLTLIYTRARAHTHTHTHTHTVRHTQTHTVRHTHTHTQTQSDTHRHTHSHTHSYAHTHTHTHTHTLTLMHTDTHTHTQKDVFLRFLCTNNNTMFTSTYFYTHFGI